MRAIAGAGLAKTACSAAIRCASPSGRGGDGGRWASGPIRVMRARQAAPGRRPAGRPRSTRRKAGTAPARQGARRRAGPGRGRTGRAGRLAAAGASLAAITSQRRTSASSGRNLAKAASLAARPAGRADAHSAPNQPARRASAAAMSNRAQVMGRTLTLDRTRSDRQGTIPAGADFRAMPASCEHFDAARAQKPPRHVGQFGRNLL